MNNIKKKDFEILFNKAETLRNSKNFLESIKILKKILTNRPKFILGLNRIAYCYYQLNRLDLAEKYYLLCQKNGPPDIQVLNNLGLIYFNNKHLKKALSVLKKSLEIKIDQLNVVEKIGYCMIELDLYSEANIFCKKFLKKYPTNNFLNSFYEKSLFKLGKNIDGLRFLQKKTGFIQFDDKKIKII